MLWTCFDGLNRYRVYRRNAAAAKRNYVAESRTADNSIGWISTNSAGCWTPHARAQATIAGGGDRDSSRITRPRQTPRKPHVTNRSMTALSRAATVNDLQVTWGFRKFLEQFKLVWCHVRRLPTREYKGNFSFSRFSLLQRKFICDTWIFPV